MNDAPTPAPLDAAPHPPLAPSRTLKTPRPPKAGELLDDRGRPVILADFTTVRQAVYEDTPPFPWRLVISWTLMAFVAGWALLSEFNVISPRFPVIYVLMLAPLIPAVAWRRGGTHATVKNDRVSCASLVRAARCGGCGFSLRELGHDADGCVACPECGAAWHPDRWRTAPTDVDAQARLAIDKATGANAQPDSLDDRGLLLVKPLRLKPAWYGKLYNRFVHDQIEPSHWNAARAFHADGRAQQQRISVRAALILAACVSISAAALWIIGFDQVDTGAYVFTFAGIMLVTAIIGSRWSTNPRRIALKHGLCPACGEQLDLSQPRQFDGCILCAKCAAAWKVDATPRETPTDSGRTTEALQPASPESPKEPARG